MEYKNDNFTPLDGADGELLRCVLGCAPSTVPLSESKNASDRRSGSRTSRGKACSCRSCDVPRSERAETRSGEPPFPFARGEGIAPEEDTGTPSTCGCGDCSGFEAPELYGVPLAMAYSPKQRWENIYECEAGFKRGTIFKCLDFPFEHSGCDCGKM